jgi:hypothetical protein
VLTGLVSSNHRVGFLILNVALVAFGVWCFAWPVRRAWRSSGAFVAFWVIIETINGVGHPLWSWRQQGYTPGVGTAPLLLVLALLLAWASCVERRAGSAREHPATAGPPPSGA